MSQLYYKETFTGVASQTTNIVLAGESSNAPASANYTIEVSGNLSGLVSYSGAYTSANIVTGTTASYPLVTINYATLGSLASAIDTTFRDKDAAGESLPTPNASVPHLQGMFKTLGWSYSTPVFPAGSSPVEAVIDVTFGAISATTFVDAIAGGTWSSNGGTSPPVNLFEQCLAAGKISGTALSDANGTGAAVFSPGDSVSVYVSYTLSKRRSYTADSSLSGTSATASITVGGVTVGSSPVTEDSDNIVKVVRWKFIQS
jgi:hypothetical protein